MNGRYTAYYRVSRASQGLNGLGMDAQRQSVQTFLNGGNWRLLAEFAEVESGKVSDRPKLLEALDFCRKHKTTLLIAKLDRLSRNAAFLLNLQESGVKFVAVDMPHADNFTVGIMALVAQKERELISVRTKAGLEQARKRGTKLGNPRAAEAIKKALKVKQERTDEFTKNLLPVIESIRKAGVTSLRGIAQCINARGLKTPNGKAFAAQSVKNYLERAKDPLYLENSVSSLEPSENK